MNDININNQDNELIFEDISSSTPVDKAKQKVEKAIKAVDDYGEGAFKNIDKVIKAISFIVAIGIFLVFAAIAVVLYMLDKMFMLIAIGVLILGVVFALISLFIIYGIGHIITQNKQLLKRKY